MTVYSIWSAAGGLEVVLFLAFFFDQDSLCPSPCAKMGDTHMNLRFTIHDLRVRGLGDACWRWWIDGEVMGQGGRKREIVRFSSLGEWMVASGH